MNDDLLDLAGELLGFADDLIPVGGKLLKLGFSVYRGGHQASSAPSWVDKISKEEAFLNGCIQTGRFDLAVRHVESMDGLPDFAKFEMVSRIHELQQKLEPEIRRLREWNDRLRQLLNQGRTDEAVRFVESLDLPWEKKREVVDSIHKAVQKAEEKRRQAETWERDINDLLHQRKFRQARKYVKTLPVPEKAKEAVLAQIPRPGWFS
jgi:type I site-specific restriction-modification system R (restriction) subunit